MENNQNKTAEHWSRTRNLMLLTLALWAFFSYVVHWFASELNATVFNSFPLGFYMAAQGSLIAFVVLLFFFAWRQNAIDEDCGVHELDDKSDSPNQ